MAVFFSCEKPGTGIINCSECKQEEPVTASIEIITVYMQNPAMINIYEGNLEDNILMDTFEAFSDRITRVVPVNRKYTVTADYNITGKSYIVVNSVYPRVLYDDESCDEPCYYVYDDMIDMRLKYTK